MKKLVSMLLAVILAVTFVSPVVLAADIAGVQSTAEPFSAIQNRTVASGGTMDIPISMAALEPFDAAVGDFTAEQLAKLSAAGVPEQFTWSFNIAETYMSDQSVVRQLVLSLTAREYYVDTDFDSNIALSMNGISTQTSRVQGTVTPKAGNLTGFNTIPARTEESDEGGDIVIYLDDSWFTYTGTGAQTISKAKLDEFGVTVSATGGFTAKLAGSGRPYIEVSHPVKAGQSFSSTITLAGGRNGMEGKSTSFALTVSVPAPPSQLDPPPVTPPAPPAKAPADSVVNNKIDGIKAGTDPTAPNGLPETMLVGGTLVFVINDDNFAYTTGLPNGEQQNNLDLLNASYKGEIKVGYYTGSTFNDLSGSFDKQFIAYGNQIAIELKANAAVTLPVGTQIGLISRYTLTKAVTIYNSTDTPVITGIAGGTLSPNPDPRPGSSITTANTLLYEILPEHFTWSHTGTRTLKVEDVPLSWISGIDASLFSYQITGGGSSLTLKLTPKKAATTAASTFTISDGTNKMIGEIPALTIYNSTDTPVITGIAGGTLSPNPQPGSTITTADSLQYVILPEHFTWSHTGTRTLKVEDVPLSWISGIDASLFSYQITGGGSSLTLKLTPKKAATTAASTFTISNGGASLTGTIPALTITNSVTTSGNKITGIADNAWLGENASKNGKPLSSTEYLDGLDIAPGDYLIFDFDSDFFTWQNGQPNPAVSVSTSMLTSGKISTRLTKKTGGDVIDKVEILSSGGKAYVRVKFVEEYKGTSAKKFDVTISFNVSSKRHTASEVRLAGELSNPIEYVDDDDYIDLSDGRIVEAQSTISNVELYVGHGITVHTRLYKGRKYYGKANTDFSSDDEALFRKHPELVMVYNINHTNLNSASSKVTFDDLNDRLYVYNGKGEYLGTSNSKLPFAEKYYVAERKIDLSYIYGKDNDNTGSGSGGSTGSGSGSTGSGSGSGTGNDVIEEPSGSGSGGSTGSGSSGSGGSGNASGNYNPPTGK